MVFFLIAGFHVQILGQKTDQVLNGIDSAFLARDNGKGAAGEETRSFRPGDVPIHCVVELKTAAPITVKLTFIAVYVAGVREGTKVVTASFSTVEGQNQIFFTGRPRDQWSPGKYRVDLSIADEVVRELEFEVVGQAAKTAVSPFAKPTTPRKPRKP